MDNTMLQIPSLLYAAYGGVWMGIWYDALGLFRFGTVSHIICDFAFWLLCLPWAFTILMQTNAMNFRLFALFGFALGFVAYFLTFGRLFRRILMVLRRALSFICSRFGELLS